MEKPQLKGVCFFGGFVEGYARSEVLRKGLNKLGVPVRSCRVSHKKKLFRRYASLLKEFRRMERDFDVILVPEFRHKDVPLAAFLARLTGKLCVFDPGPGSIHKLYHVVEQKVVAPLFVREFEE